MRSIIDSDPDVAVFLELRMEEIFRRMRAQGWDDRDIGVVLDEMIDRYRRGTDPDEIRQRIAM